MTLRFAYLTAGQKSVCIWDALRKANLITGYPWLFSVLEQTNAALRSFHAALPKPIWTFLPKRSPPNAIKIKNEAIQINPARTTNFFPLLHTPIDYLSSLDLPHSPTLCLATSLPSTEGRAGVVCEHRAQSISPLSSPPQLTKLCLSLYHFFIFLSFVFLLLPPPPPHHSFLLITIYVSSG